VHHGGEETAAPAEPAEGGSETGEVVSGPAAPLEPGPAQPPPDGQMNLTRPLGDCPGQSEGFGPINWPPSEVGNRWGHGITNAAQVQSSRAVPIEVCGVQGELQWLVSLTCADGSSPFASTRDAHGSRQGSIGAGGRCDSIIDLYSVPCPERTYEVYLDMYQCGPGESFF